MVCFLVIRTLFDEVEHIVDGLFRIVSGNSRLDVREKLAIVLDSLMRPLARSYLMERRLYLVISTKLEFELDSLF